MPNALGVSPSQMVAAQGRSFGINERSNTGALLVKDDGNIFCCQKCNTRHCLLCDVPFHEDQTCDEYQEAKQRAVEEEESAAKRRVEEETASAEAVKKMSRPCPECGVNIDKFAGCDHVTCELPPSLSHFLSLYRATVLTMVSHRSEVSS